MTTQTQPFNQLIKEGRICAPRIYCPDLGVVDFDNIGLSGIERFIVNPYQQYCAGKKAIVFCVSTAHAEATTAAFNESGIRAASFLGIYPMEQRKQIFEQFRTGEVMVLVSVALLLTEFYRRPEVDAVIMADPTHSRGKYFNQVAAALAPRFSPGMPTLTSEQRCAAIEASSKPHGIVIDAAGNVLRHGVADFADAPRPAQTEPLVPAPMPGQSTMVAVPVVNLTKQALAYAVAVAEGLGDELAWHFNEDGSFHNIWTDDHGSYRPDEDGALGMDLIHKHKVWLSPPVPDPCPDEPHGWDAEIYDDAGNEVIGHAIGCPTALVAICRAVVLAKLGGAVQVPEELSRG